MTLLDRTLMKRLWVNSLFAMVVFTLAWLAPEILFNAIQYVTHDVFTVEQGVFFMLYQVPKVLTYCIPISMLLASVFLFRQLSLSTELTAMLASGISFWRILVPVGVVGLGMTALFFLTQEVLMPLATYKERKLNQATQFDPGEITYPQVTFVEKTPDGAMKKFLVISPTSREEQSTFIFLFFAGQGDSYHISRMLTANRGVWDPVRERWQLEDGMEYHLNREGIYRMVAPFRRREVASSPVAHALLDFPAGNPREFTTRKLEKFVRLLRRSGQSEDARFYEVRLYQRYFLPMVPFLLALLGAGIGVERSRARRNLGLTYAALLLLFYNVMVPVNTTLGSIGVLPAFLAGFLPVVLCLAAGGLIIRARQMEA